MCARPGGGINGGIGFPISPGLMGATNHPSTPSCTSIGGQRKRRYAVRGAAPPTALLPRPWCMWDRETPLCRGRDCPPTALFLGRAVSGQRGSAATPWEGLPPHRIAPHLWCFVERHVLKTCREFSGKSWGTMVKFFPPRQNVRGRRELKPSPTSIMLI